MEAAADSVDRSPSVAALLAEGTAALAAAGVSSPRLDAEVLLATACGVDRTALYVRANLPAAPAAARVFGTLLERRRRREPLQYIVGRQEFWSLDFVVTPEVLIPRPETELLVELALAIGSGVGTSEPVRRGMNSPAESSKSPLKGTPMLCVESASADFVPISRGILFPGGRSTDGSRSWGRPVATGCVPGDTLQPPLTICDLGTGSGCLAIALAREVPHAEVWAIDRSPAAVAVARANARRHGVERVRCVAGDLFAPVVERRFDLIVSNPPYIASPVLAGLQPELAWEPRGALDGGSDGLDVVRRLLNDAPARLVSGGWLLVEIGADQGPAALRLAGAAGFRDVSLRKDYAGRSRVLLARRT
jgi:release factor glutamine methyltransferase